MKSKVYDEFFQALAQIVEEERPYKEKISALLRQMTEHDHTNIEELASWLGLTEG